ncbi:MAG: transglutaminaseTgpA domain-containing protein, partial [Streptosporangiaceae bacterium]
MLCIATGAGLVAVLTRSIWARQEAGGGALPALLPTFGLFCYTALLSSQVDRLAGAVAYLASALAFVIVADGSTRSILGAGGRALVPAVLGAALAVVVPLAASPALATLAVNALPFGEPNGPGVLGVGLAPDGSGAGGGLGATGGVGAFTGLRAIDLVDNLKAVLVNRTTELMFEATTPVPTYWQVAVLTRFDGTTWSPDPTTQAAAQSDALSPPSRVPGLPALPEPQPAKTFDAQVTIANLQSTLLPLPPTTGSVNAEADLVPGFGGIQAVEAQPGQGYTAVARIPVNPVKAPPGGTPATGSVPSSSLAPYLGLPAEPGPVVALAHQIVSGATGPAAQAGALARWFDTGRYRYTLSPPVPSGSNALESFLFTTRAGFCQQFAAAFGVLARIDGLPTRIAVGFTTGAGRGHQYRVTGADAHVWPEVYLGPSTGWTSYEPTPASSGEATGVGVNTGSRTST